MAPKKRPKPDTEDEESASERPSLHDDSLLSVTPPKAKKQKKAPAPKKSDAKALQEVQNEATGLDGAEDAKPKKGSKSTETYQKVNTIIPIVEIAASLTLTSSPNWNTSSNDRTLILDRPSEAKSRCGFTIAKRR